ncbi:hypothetical protein [Stieleria neptunia]|uniref:hypothetical protein n=1 Tax=Stieleria neptunia TaxID=2527979 RepID=UPI0011A17F7F|nr:hypothetical protein [Stieleria neptunia]
MRHSIVAHFTVTGIVDPRHNVQGLTSLFIPSPPPHPRWAHCVRRDVLAPVRVHAWARAEGYGGNRPILAMIRLISSRPNQP